MIPIAAKVQGWKLQLEVEDVAPLAWRWWRRTYSGYRFRDERALVLRYVDPDGIFGIGKSTVLIAMQSDHSLQLTSCYSLFPILDDAEALDGAADAARAILQRYAVSPSLL